MKNSFFIKIFVGYIVVILLFSAMSLIAFSGAFGELHRRTLTDNLTNIGLPSRMKRLRPAGARKTGAVWKGRSGTSGDS